MSHEQNFTSLEALITAFSKLKPEDGLTVHAFVSDVGGVAGYALVEANDPKVIASFVSKYNSWNDVKVVPVIDAAEIVPINAASLAWARSASKSRIRSAANGRHLRRPIRARRNRAGLVSGGRFPWDHAVISDNAGGKTLVPGGPCVAVPNNWHWRRIVL